MRNKAKISKDLHYIYGKHPVFAALSNPKRYIQNVLCTEDIFNLHKNLISNHPYEITNIDYLTRLFGSNHNHQGIAANVKSIFSNRIEDIDITIPNCKVAILDQITDPQNIGAIIRSAASFDITTIILPLDNAPDENATIAKTASGALELVQMVKVTNLRWSIEYLKKHGFWIIGLDGNAKQSLSTKIFSDKMAIVLGSEDKGIRRLVKEACDHLVKIPISSKVESLNVSNAAAIAFYLISLEAK
ncbi:MULTISPECIES: 23S rRNA (guanosine(2251)-2'-O)-methyltransferase RlmB [unclassified Candidatus Tisiphia]|jgi:23S rRNA (guanosine2251-2'-O)-methyltransferase|uniref:23S rRNA (guanosine(2251)-2'-O)-methyltransferase RlmB n=1 Tax=unclassified Candidatus Tisiphia TaxID=2996318 RepID=UPI001E6A55FF|nr:MAG: 23S rRNA (guanosine(2251)-2'-O)-methyltransferase RlmB [Rickettsia endosymbiont of Cimex lectularius]